MLKGAMLQRMLVTEQLNCLATFITFQLLWQVFVIVQCVHVLTRYTCIVCACEWCVTCMVCTCVCDVRGMCYMHGVCNVHVCVTVYTSYWVQGLLLAQAISYSTLARWCIQQQRQYQSIASQMQDIVHGGQHTHAHMYTTAAKTKIFVEQCFCVLCTQLQPASVK